MSDDTVDRSHQFLLMWCCEGLEYVGDLTQDAQDAVWSRLRDEKYQSQIPNLMHLEIRARYNSQRFYEIYVVQATEGITKEHLVEMFENDPQTAAQLIRKKGIKIFGEPMSSSQRNVIT
jgi:hypothetical protein